MFEVLSLLESFVVTSLPTVAALVAFGMTFTFCRSYLPIASLPALAFVIALGISSSPGVAANTELLIIVLRSIVTGFIVASPYALLFELSSVASRVLETVSGLNVVEQFSPGEERASLLEPIAILLPIIVAFEQGWHHLALRALLFDMPEFTFEGIADSAIRESSLLLSIAILMMFSIFCVSITVDVAGGFLGRLVPRLQIQSELMVVKLLSGGAVAWLLSSTVSLPRWLQSYSSILEGR